VPTVSARQGGKGWGIRRIRPSACAMPSAGIAAGLFVIDPDGSFGVASCHSNTWKKGFRTMVGAALDTTAAMYAWGHLTNNGSTRETGVLATEAMLDVLPVHYALRGAWGRLWPDQIGTAGHEAHSSPT
ncbi:MAG TPA: hypothetical protein VF783_11775, partial [Terriglobales bacterium]